jgi:hypothetical protein
MLMKAVTASASRHGGEVLSELQNGREQKRGIRRYEQI